MAAERMPELPFTIKDVASMYGMSKETIRKEISAGRLKARHRRGNSRTWYITKEAIEEWIANMLEDA